MISGDEKGAIFCYQESVKLRPGIPDVWYNLARLFEKTGERKEALATHITAGKLFPADYRFSAERARLLAESGKYTEAVNAASDALASAPYSPTLLANKAGYLIFAGNPDEARQTAEQALAIDPGCALAYLHKAHAESLLGNAAKAKETMETGLSSVPDDGRLLKLQANLLIRSEDFEAGLASIEKVLLLDPNDAESWSLKGAASAYLGRKEDAISAFEQAMKLDPKEKAYRQNRDAVRKG
ncbi:Tetratricopeptide TPR_2 repeat protein [Methanocorpusculum labreanum Z]|uniref:Tetratricopeptide TPR_2 repeat protein n=2 Tax=Methanocorpusculum labreanum TaxID=83984 RepID=A2STG3_METLZ|nr:Tetratricopeptide TPR_2 repeat protein [Methanocorpusculum labreanum Z]